MKSYLHHCLIVLASLLLLPSSQAAVTLQFHEEFASGATFNGSLTFSDNFDTLLGVSGTLAGGGYGTDQFTWTLLLGTSQNATAVDWDGNPNTYEDWLMGGSPASFSHSIGISWQFPVTGSSPVFVLSPMADVTYAGIDGADVASAYSFQSASAPEGNSCAMLLIGAAMLLFSVKGRVKNGYRIHALFLILIFVVPGIVKADSYPATRIWGTMYTAVLSNDRLVQNPYKTEKAACDSFCLEWTKNVGSYSCYAYQPPWPDTGSFWASCGPNGEYGNQYGLRRGWDCPGGGILGWYSCVNAPSCAGQGEYRDANGDCAPSPKNALEGDCESERKGVVQVGNPVNAGTGTKWLSDVDYASAGVVDISLKRKYTSLSVQAAGNDGSLGSSWRSGFAASLSVDPVGTPNPRWVYARRADGRTFTYLAGTSATTWVVDGDLLDTLYPITNASGVRTGWRYYSAGSGELETYSASGKLLSITSRSGVVRMLSYDGSSRLVSVSDPFGRSLGFAYDSSNRINRVTQPDGGVIQYSYDASGNLANVTYPDGSARNYLYGESAYVIGANLPYALTGLIDELGNRYATWTYDSQGRATSSQHAGGAELTRLSYGTNSTTVTDPLGTARSYNFSTVLGVAKSTGTSQPGGSGCSAASSALSYDANGNVTSRKDFNGNQTCYAYDTSRNLESKRVEGLAASASCTTVLSTPPTPTSANPVRTINTQWHSYWRLPVKTAEPQKITSWVFNGDTYNGSTVSCAPAGTTVPTVSGGSQPIGVLCQKIEQATTDTTGSQGFSATASGTARTWRYTYNAYGQILTATGPRSDVTDLTTYTYYSASDSDLAKRGNLASVTDALGHVTTFGAYDLNGRPLSISDPNGVVTSLSYDARGRLTQSSVGGEATAYRYDAAGQLIQITLADTSTLSYTYDAAHRLTAIQDSLGNRITYTLDAAGNRTREDVSDPAGSLVRTQSRVFDALGRMQNLVLPQ